MAQQLPDTYYRTPYKFNSKELDEETGLYYYGARYYDPKISIWLSVDPLAESYPNFNPYNYCMQNPINLVDPDGRSASPIYGLDGKYLGVDSKGFLRGDILFMDEEKFNKLSNNGQNKIDHNIAQANSKYTMANLPNTKEGSELFSLAADHVSKSLYKLYYGEDPTNKLAGGMVQTFSDNLNRGSKFSDRLDGDYGINVNYYGEVDRVTLSFDHRRVLNTAPNIFTLFEHEFYGHGILGIRQKFGKFDCHAPIYKMSVESPNFKYVTGPYREHTIEMHNIYNPNEKINE